MSGKFDDAWPFILIVGAFISGLLVGKFQFTDKWQTGWEMVSGLGSFAAVAVALRIAGNDRRNRQDEAYAKMCLVAARLYLPLIEASRRLGFIAHTARESGCTIDSKEPYDLLLAELRRTSLSITHEDLVALIPLPDGAVNLLSRALGNIGVAIGTFESSEFIFCSGKHLIKRPSIMMKIEDLATEASQQLEMVAIKCQKASNSLTIPHR